MSASDIKALSNISPKGQVTIPAEMRRALGLEPGGKVRFVLKGRHVLIEAYKEPPISSLFGLAKAKKGRGVADIDEALEQARIENAGEKGLWRG